jgi:hypothetical protein
MSKKTYTVWVGGSEVNDSYLTKEEAENLASEYKADGYDDVVVENILNKFGRLKYFTYLCNV